MDEDGVFYHEHGSWDERIRIRIAKLKTDARWTAYIGIAILILGAIAKSGLIIVTTLAAMLTVEAVLFLELLYAKQLYKTKHSGIAA